MFLPPVTRALKTPQFYGSVLAVSLIGFAAGALAVDTPQAPQTVKSWGYVFSDINTMGYNNGPGDCPDGLAVSPLDLYVASITPAERERISHLTKAELKAQVFTKIPGYGDGVDFELDNGYAASHDACTAPQDYLDTPTGEKIFKGPIAYGMNLDGSDGSKPAPNTCAHEKFVSPTGAKGVDNQLIRATGCQPMRRGLPASVKSATTAQTGPKRVSAGIARSTYLLEITAPDDRNADNVQVAIYSSLDPVPVDASGNLLAEASLHIIDAPRLANLTRGKIVDGVLTTEPFDVRLLPKQMYTSQSERFFRGARLRVQLHPDGTMDGMLAGYEDVDLYYAHVVESGGFNNEINSGYTCVGVYKAVHELADGYPDPKTGKCTAISTAYGLAGVSTFIIHPKEGEKMPQIATADRVAGGTKVGRWLKSIGW